jgi:hypothetical protein
MRDSREEFESTLSLMKFNDENSNEAEEFKKTAII